MNGKFLKDGEDGFRMLKIFKYFSKKEWIMAFISFVFIIAQVWLELSIPQHMAQITTLVQTPGSAMGDVWRAGGLMMVATIGSLICAIIIGYFVAIIGARFSRRLRTLLFDKVDSFGLEEINHFSTDSLITRSTNDITQVQALITMGITTIVRAPIMAIWAMTRIVGKGFVWTAITAVAILIMLTMITFIMYFVIPKFRKMQSLIDNMNRVTRESLTGIRVVRAYNAEKFQENKFEEANDEITNTQLFTSRSMAITMPVLSFIMSGVNLSIYWVGAYLIDGVNYVDRLEIFANMVVFSAYAVQVIMSFIMLTMIFIMLPRATVSAKRIREVLDKNPKLKEGNVTSGNLQFQGEIEFKNVSFKYPGASEDILTDINFKVKKGETVAFIGSTGSGKSTLINLIPRFFDASSGQVLIDGIDVKEYKIESLNEKIGYVSQKAILFKGSIASNVAFGLNNEAGFDKKQVSRAVSIAQATDFVETKDDQYDSEVTQGGTNLSGGQKQRISIARAIYRNPEILIFDDSFSALDYKTDRLLRHTLKEKNEGITNLIVAQRIGTIMDSDQIIVLDEGKIVGMGKHKDLLKSCEVYLQIATSQLTEEELAI